MSSFSIILCLLFYLITRISCRTYHKTCSKEINFKRLCPQPIQSLKAQHLRQSDVFISLAHHYQQPDVPGCNFYKSKAVLSGVHASNIPWDFTAAEECNHNVKFLQDHEGDVGTSPICRQEIGMRLLKIGDNETLNVFMWHNFTFYQDRITFIDKITNYDYSKEDLSCSENPRFVQIIIVTSVDTICTLLIQQYEIDLKRHGCDYTNLYRHQFCGIYSCKATNNIIEKLKLIPKRLKDRRGPPEEDGLEPTIKVAPTAEHSNNETSVILPKVPETTSIGEMIVTAGFPIGGIVLVILGFYCLRQQYSRHECKIGINLQRQNMVRVNGL